jgi:nitrate reductase delta subunit
MFDMNPAASLNLTYHVMGDREERGSALAALAEVYRQAGYEPALNELPDFLPLVLEFLYESPGAEADPLLGRCLAALPAVAGSLRKNGSGYAGLLDVLCGMLAAERDLTGENSVPESARDPLSNPNRGA